MNSWFWIWFTVYIWLQTYKHMSMKHCCKQIKMMVLKQLCRGKQNRGEKIHILLLFRHNETNMSALRWVWKEWAWGLGEETRQAIWERSDADSIKWGVLWVQLFLVTVRRHTLAAFLCPPRLPTSLYSKLLLSTVHHVTGAAQNPAVHQRWHRNTKQPRMKKTAEYKGYSLALNVSSQRLSREIIQLT